MLELERAKFLVPFADFTVIDTGKAYAQVGPFRSDAQSNVFAVHGGMRFIGGTSRVRPYAQFGGGVLHENLKATFTVAGLASQRSGSASVGSFLYGGGVQLFASRHFGADVGFDGFRVSQPINGAGQNYSRVHFGVFYQTKSSIR